MAEQTYEVSAPALRRALTTAATFTDQAEGLPVLRSVHLEPEGDGAVAVGASDRFVLSREVLPVTGEPWPLLLDPHERRLITTLITGDVEVVRIERDGRVVTVRTLGGLAAAIVTFTPVRDAGYPNLRALVERAAGATETRSAVLLDPAKLRRALGALEARDPRAPVEMSMPGVAPMSPITLTSGGVTVLVMPVKRVAEKQDGGES